MAEALTIVLVGGGTGGHLYPGISVAQSLREKLPDCRIVFFCTARELDRSILEPTGYEFVEQPIVPPQKSVGGLLKFWNSWRDTKDLLYKWMKSTRPNAVLGLGGYAAGVGVKLAAQRKIATAILNPDVIPGKANLYLARYSQAICSQFEQTRSRLPAKEQQKMQVTGCPIRSDILRRPAREDAIKRLGLDPAQQTLVITGASQGAQTVNEAVLTALPRLKLQGWQILHLSGKDHSVSVRQGYRDADLSAAVVDFTPDMADVWAVADLAISRAGASSIAELCVCGVPSILMPYPYHKDMHQRANAQVVADAGAGILLDDQKDRIKNADKLTPILESLLFDATKRVTMTRAATSLGRPDAAHAVAQVLIQLASAGR